MASNAEYKRKWRETHPEKIRAYRQKYNTLHSEHIKEYYRKYYLYLKKEHPEKLKAYRHRAFKKYYQPHPRPKTMPKKLEATKPNITISVEEVLDSLENQRGKWL